MDNTSDSLERSHRILKATFLANLTFVPISILAIIFNILLIIIIFLSKKLHTKCFILLAANGFSDFLLGLGYAIVDSIRVSRYLLGQNELLNMWQCFGQSCIIAFAQLLSLAMAFVLVIDRLLATYCPHRYKKWTYARLTVPLLICAYALALAQLAIHVRDSWEGRYVILHSCGIEETVYPETLSTMTTIQMIISGMVVICNIALAFGLIRRKRKIQAMNNQRLQEEVARSHMETKIFKTVTIIAVTHVLTHLAGRLVILIMMNLGDETAIAITNRVGRQIVVANAVAHFFVLLIMSTDFRDATRQLANRLVRFLCCKLF